MKVRGKALLASAGLVSITLLSATGCKALEPYDDAPASSHLNGAAQVGDMPDGFSNWADKCDNHGNRVFTIFHSDSGYGSISVTRDPSCPGYIPPTGK